jgi:NAD(P)-dependent dehydrogenase (short-subunit alcohol dehydrogenase family)
MGEVGMTNDQMPRDRVAIVVGAAGELGRATAVTLANRGMTVVAVDRNQAGLDGLPDGMSRRVVDAVDANAAAPMVERIAQAVGPPYALVNTIGAFQTGDALTTTPDLLHQMIDVNLGPALWLSQAVAPYMQRNGSGAIVHLAARPGIEPSAGTAAYSASKAALIHLTRILDLELRPLGIRVNSVAPQLLDTATARASFPKEVLTHAVAPEAIAEVIAFLVSEASAPISGAILPAYGA